jgi:hypothetical protein
VAAGGAPPACTAGEPLETFGQSYGWINEQPVLVAAGSTGSFTACGTRTVELNSSVPISCFNGAGVTPVTGSSTPSGGPGTGWRRS